MSKPKLTYQFAFRTEENIGRFFETLAERDYREPNDYIRVILRKLAENGTVTIPVTLSELEQQDKQKD